LTAISQWDEICDNNLTQGNNTTSPDALDRSADQHVREVVANGSNDGTNTEEEDGNKNHRAATEYV
jgi:hypothetical protein